MSSSPDKVSEMKLLLVGKTGVGKSSTGNSILGMKKFETCLSMKSVTKETQYAEVCRLGRHMVVVDTPGFYDTDRSNKDITREIMKICGYLSSGFHALLYVVGIDKFTEENIKTKDLFLKIFGELVTKHTILVVTHFDCLEQEKVDLQQFLITGGQEFVKFQQLFNNRVFFMNNFAVGKKMDAQIQELFVLVDEVVHQNAGQCFTTYHMKMVRAFTRIERKKRKINIIRARRALFEKARKKLGIENVVVWDSGKNSPVIFSAGSDLRSLSNIGAMEQIPRRTITRVKIKAIPVPRASVIPGIKAIPVPRASVIPGIDKTKTPKELVGANSVQIKELSLADDKTDPHSEETTDVASGKADDTTTGVASGKADDTTTGVASGKAVDTNGQDSTGIEPEIVDIFNDLDPETEHYLTSDVASGKADDTTTGVASGKADDTTTGVASGKAVDTNGQDSTGIEPEIVDIFNDLDPETEHHLTSDEVKSLYQHDADDRRDLQNKDFFERFAEFFSNLFAALMMKK